MMPKKPMVGKKRNNTKYNQIFLNYQKSRKKSQGDLLEYIAKAKEIKKYKQNVKIHIEDLSSSGPHMNFRKRKYRGEKQEINNRRKFPRAKERYVLYRLQGLTKYRAEK